MKIENYLHLYKGCLVLGIKSGEIAPLNIIDEKVEAIAYSGQIKLLLRPFSDLQKEEMIELWNSIFWYKFTANCRVQRIDKNTTSSDPRWVLMAGVERLGIEDNGTVWADCDLSHYKHNQHEVTRWFLSKHFDLFGLIKAELAIDKTTLQQNDRPNGFAEGSVGANTNTQGDAKLETSSGIA